MEHERAGKTSTSISPEIKKALAAAYRALAGDSNDAEYEALLGLMEAIEKTTATEKETHSHDAPRATATASLPRSHGDNSASAINNLPAEGIKMNVPTYNGKWLEEYPGLNEFDEPHVPLLICPADGLRVILGTHDYQELSKPDIQIERRHNGWMIFLHPVGGWDESGYVVFLDDGRSFVAAERGAGDHAIEMVDYGRAIAELDELRPDGISCAPVTIVDRPRRTET